MCQKWLINVSEEPDARDATLDDENSLKKCKLDLSWFVVLQLFERVKNTFDYDSYTIEICFKLDESM